MTAANAPVISSNGRPSKQRAPLRQRIAIRQHIPPLAWEEIGEYIRHRLHVAGGGDRIKWSDGALLLVRRYTRGVPRLINVICDKTLLAGYIHETFTIDAGLVQRAIEDTECKQPSEVAVP